MSHDLPPKQIEVGDFVQIQNPGTCIRVVEGKSQTHLRLQDPLTGFNETNLFPIEKVHLFRTTTSLRCFSSITSLAKRRVDFQESKCQQLQQKVEKVMRSPLEHSPKDIIQLVRGKYYFLMWTLIKLRIEDTKVYKFIMSLFEKQRDLMVIFLEKVDFTHYERANPYSNSSNAFCSCYIQMIELTQMATGCLQEMSELRNSNPTFFRRQHFKVEDVKWLNQSFLPAFPRNRRQLLPYDVIARLMVLAIKIVKYADIGLNQALLIFFQENYNELKRKMQTQNVSVQQSNNFHRNSTSIFGFVYEGVVNNILGERASNSSEHTQRLQSQSQPQKEQKKMVDSVPDQNRFTRQQFIRNREIEHRLLTVKILLAQGKPVIAANDINTCVIEVMKEVRGRQDAMVDEQNWPKSCYDFLREMRELTICRKLLNQIKGESHCASIRNPFSKLYYFFPKEMLTLCSQKFNLEIVRQIFAGKIIKTDIVAWWAMHLSKKQCPDDQIKQYVKMLAYVDKLVKDNHSMPGLQQLRIEVLYRQLNLAKSNKVKEPELFSNLISPLEDGIKRNLLCQYVQLELFPKCDQLLGIFQEYMISMYAYRFKVKEQHFRLLLQPMLQRQKEASLFFRRKKTILLILNFAFNEQECQFSNYLRIFLQFHKHEDHDQDLEVNHWHDTESIYPESVNGQVKFCTKVSIKECKQFIRKLMPLKSSIDVKMFHILFLNINISKKKIQSQTQKIQIFSVLQKPAFFSELIQALYQLPLDKRSILIKDILNIFEKAKEKEVHDQLLESMWHVLFKNKFSDMKINNLFKRVKTKYQNTKTIEEMKKEEKFKHFKIKFTNKTAKDFYVFKIHQLPSSRDVKFRTVIAQHDSKLSQNISIFQNQLLKNIKLQLANLINVQPSEIVLLNQKDEECSPRILETLFKLVVDNFIDREVIKKMRIEGKMPEIEISYLLSRKLSTIYPLVCDHTQQLLEMVPNSTKILSEINFISDCWSLFDNQCILAREIESSLKKQKIPDIYFQEQFYLNLLLDYFLWKKDHKELKIFKVHNLFALTKRIGKKQDILLNMKILELIRMTRSFDPDKKEQLLEAASFKEGQEEGLANQFQDQKIYLDLLDLVFDILQDKPQDGLNFCFTTSRVDEYYEIEAFWNKFFSFWRTMYLHSSFSDKQKLFENIDEKIIAFPQNMKYLSNIIQDKVQNEKHKELYEEVLMKLAKLVFSFKNIPPQKIQPNLISNLLCNIQSFIQKQINCIFLQSQQFCKFLLTIFYDYVEQNSSNIYHLLNYTISNENNRRAVLQFFMKQVDYQQFKNQQDLESRNRFYDTRYQSKYIGLINPRSTCYAISLFQQLYHNQTFTKELLATTWRPQDNLDEDVVYQLKKIFIRLKESQRPYEHHQFFTKAFIWDDNVVGIFTQYDADQFRNRLFDTLQQILPQNMFWKKIFQGQQQSRIICQECGNISTKKQTFNSICLTVQGIQNFEQSLEDHNKGIVLEGDNAYSCEKCNKKVKAVKEEQVVLLPRHLTFVLKRFRYRNDEGQRQKISSRFQFPMDQFKWKEGYFYRLKGVICHQGSAQHGHYISYIKIEGQWYQFDDWRVKIVTQRQVETATFGPTASKNPSFWAKTAYLLFYEQVGLPAQMEEQQQLVGVDKELKDIEWQKIFMVKSAAFLNRNYFNFILNVASEFQSIDSLRLLYLSLITIFFRYKENKQKFKQILARNIDKSLTLLSKNRQKCQFINQEYIYATSFILLSRPIPTEYKMFIVALIIQNCTQLEEYHRASLSHSLISIIKPSIDVSSIYFLLNKLNNKIDSVGDFLHQQRAIGKILQSSLCYKTKDLAIQMKMTHKQIPEGLFKNNFSPPFILETHKYHKWQLLTSLLTRFGSNLHEIQKKYLHYQLQKDALEQILKSFQSHQKSTVHSIGKYLCYLLRNNPIEFTYKMMTLIRDRILNGNIKNDSIRNYCYVLKMFLEIDDKYNTERMNIGINVWVKLFNRNNSNFFYDLTFDYLWLWFLRIAGSNPRFRQAVHQNKGLFLFLISRNYSNQGFAKCKDQNMSIIRSKQRVYLLPIPMKSSEVLAYHSQKVQKTKAILNSEQYNYQQDQDEVRIWEESELDQTSSICKFNQNSQQFEGLSIKWIFGQLIAINSRMQLPANRSFHFLYKGDERLTFDSNLSVTEQSGSSQNFSSENSQERAPLPEGAPPHSKQERKGN